MDAVGPGPLRFGHLLSQPSEVGVEDRRGQLHCVVSHFTNLSPSRRASLGAGALKYVHKLAVSARDLGHGGLARYLLCPQVNERIPETGPAHCKADEPRDAGRRRQPFAHFLVIFASAQNYATYFIPISTPRR